MAQFILSLGVVVLSVLVSALAGGWNQEGGRPGFGHIGFGDGKCSAMQAVLPDPKSGCCGKHADTDGSGPDDNNGGADQGVGAGDGNGVDDGTGGYGPGGDNGQGYGPGDDDDYGNDFDKIWNIGNWNSDNSGTWEHGNNEIGDFDFGNSFFEGDNRYKRSADKNASDVAPDKYIIAGKSAGLSQYPWLVHLTVKVQDKMIGCGDPSSAPVTVSVYLAEYNTRTFPTDCVGRHCVKNLMVHPDKITKHNRYNRDALHNDIAMMRLSKTAPYTDYIRPICLPQFNINTAKYQGTPLTVAGWGQTEYGQPSSVKLHTQVAQVPPNACRRHYPDITEGQLCAAGKSGQDTCMGDSGGPIMMEQDGTFYLVGLVSGKRSDAGCGSPVPTMYTNVFAYTKWIQNFMRN